MKDLFIIENTSKKQLFQWDMNQRFIVNYPLITQAHFCVSIKEEPLSCEVFEEDGILLVNIPNIILQKAGKYRVYAYCEDSTLEYMQFEVEARPKPADYLYTETEIITVDKLIRDNIVALEGNIDALEGNIDALKDRMEIVEGYAVALEGNIDALKDRMEIVELQQSSADNLLNEHAAHLEVHDNTLSGHEFTLSMLSGENAALFSRVEAVEASLGTAQSTLAEVVEGGAFV